MTDKSSIRNNTKAVDNQPPLSPQSSSTSGPMPVGSRAISVEANVSAAMAFSESHSSLTSLDSGAEAVRAALAALREAEFWETARQAAAYEACGLRYRPGVYEASATRDTDEVASGCRPNSGRALLIQAPNSAPSICRHAPWRHPLYEGFMPPSPSANEESSLHLSTTTKSISGQCSSTASVVSRVIERSFSSDKVGMLTTTYFRYFIYK
ncbi:unnamed protein product [Protopolystoma xenopodis]|uniref:Uncharacterized protein n=1 Tax=Protopolystoma xenopodis TaxID=117903 RepID=A0A3S5FHF1_9PLAT|nr:unnamed protein product [Protopolystoma xenopodis]